MKRFSTLEQGTMGYETCGAKYVSKLSSPGLYSIWLQSSRGAFFSGFVKARNHKQAVIKADELGYGIPYWKRGECV